ncbi:hypothetical protein X975_24021, partial [Stegodyphus mimosarum]
MAGSDSNHTAVHAQMDTSPPELHLIQRRQPNRIRTILFRTMILILRILSLKYALNTLKARFTDLEQTLSRAKRATP